MSAMASSDSETFSVGIATAFSRDTQLTLSPEPVGVGAHINNHLIKNFTPAFFIPVMGTGICSTILRSFPYQAQWLRVCGDIMWAIAIITFLSMFSCLIISVIKYPRRSTRFNFDIPVALFMGCLPMGFTTLVNYFFLLTGKKYIYVAWALWWVALAGSLYTACITFFLSLVMKREGEKNVTPLQNLHATILLPVVTLTVAASSGALISPSLPSIEHQLLTTTISFLAWAIAISIGWNILIPIYFSKLLVHKAPPKTLVFTSFLPIGLVGQAAFGIMLISRNVFDMGQNPDFLASNFFTTPISADASAVVGYMALSAGGAACLFLMAFGYYLTAMAVLVCISKLEHKLISFNMSYWAMTFPLGTMALANNALYSNFNGFEAMRVVSAIYGATVATIVVNCLWGTIFIMGRSVWRAAHPEQKSMV